MPGAADSHSWPLEPSPRPFGSGPSLSHFVGEGFWELVELGAGWYYVLSFAALISPSATASGARMKGFSASSSESRDGTVGTPAARRPAT